MYNQTCRLIDNHHIVIFENNGKFDRFRCKCKFFLGKLGKNHDLFISDHRLFCLCGFAIDRDLSLIHILFASWGNFMISPTL